VLAERFGLRKEVNPVKWKALLLLVAVILSFSTAYADPLESSSFPSLLTSIKLGTVPDFCGEQVPIGEQEVRERLEKELLLALWNRPQVILWLKRSKRYLPYIEELLRNEGMPEDLKYVALAESALRPHAHSRSGAVGFWQFVSYTGEKYGLVINSRIDERRNIFASTRAAIKYFKDLHEIFGSWTLAAAAYNMGEEGLMAEVLEQGNNDYYNLQLPLETERYILRIIAIKLILTDPAKYGFYLLDEDYYPPLHFDQVDIKCADETPIRIVAKAAKTTFKAIKELNPEIRGHYLPEGSYTILIPEGGSGDFQDRYRSLIRQWSSNQQEQIYFVKEGDNLSAIAERFDVPLASLIIWNRLNPRTTIHPGDRLIVYPQKPVYVDIDSENNDNTGAALNND
jgi:membrane-bound lytic murein transglycosylase D